MEIHKEMHNRKMLNACIKTWCYTRNTIIVCMLDTLFSYWLIPSRWWILKVWWVRWMNKVSCWRKEPSCTSCRLSDCWQLLQNTHLLLPADLTTRSVATQSQSHPSAVKEMFECMIGVREAKKLDMILESNNNIHAASMQCPNTWRH